MEDRRKLLELIAKGKLDANSLINPNQDIYSKALDARDLTQSALAQQVLQNTGIPIPARGARATKLEDFYQQIAAERYPELKNTKIDLEDLSKDNARGMYFGNDKQKWIEIQKDLWKKNPESATGTLLHELGHNYDDEILGQRGKAISSNLKLPDSMNPEEAYEIMANRHHVDYIPNKREVGSFGKGALSSLMKSGTFRALPIVGGLAAASMSGDASAAIPLLDQAENIGESPEEEKQMLVERDAITDYQNSPARQNRLEVLKKLQK